MSKLTDECERLLTAATPEPWYHVTNEVWDDPGYIRTAPGFGDDSLPIAHCSGMDPRRRAPEADAALIAAAPRLIRELLGEIGKLREVAEAARHRGQCHGSTCACDTAILSALATLTTSKGTGNE